MLPIPQTRARTWISCLASAVALSTMLLGPGSAVAQDYPTRPIKIIVGYPPGGSNDIVARIIAPPLGEELGVPVIVENRAGASGTIGADAVAKAAPDGYTLMVTSASPVVITPHTMEKVPFDTPRDFAAVNTVGLTPEVIAVRSALPVHSLKELLALAQKQQVSLSSSGSGGLPHLTIELIKQAHKGNILHVPYKGAAPAMTDTIAGHVDGIVMDLPPLFPMIKDGRLRPLAVTSAKRVDFLPDVPTALEELPGFDVVNWLGVLAPAKTPQKVIDRLNAALIKIVARPDVKEKLSNVAVVPSTMESPAAFQKFLAAEYARWGKVVKESGTTATN
jgi:tripartite-type tricarboxylate transporter receptor subunit TctC